MDNHDERAVPGAGSEDRRVHHDLRPIFDKAIEITAPFFDSKESWGGASLTMYARQALRDAFPELTQQETAILISAVSRVHKASPNLRKH